MSQKSSVPQAISFVSQVLKRDMSRLALKISRCPKGRRKLQDKRDWEAIDCLLLRALRINWGV